MKKAIRSLVILMIVLGLVPVAIYLYATKQAQSGFRQGPEVDFEVPKGAHARSISAQLEKSGLVAHANLFRFAVWQRGGLALKAGKFKLSPALSPLELASALEKPPLADEEPFVIVEGWRIRDVDEALAAAGRADAGAYLQAASSGKGYTAPFPLPDGSLEGYLYPETYSLPQGRIDPRQLVQKQLDLFAERMYRPLATTLQNEKRSLHELVIMASMLEREEPVPSNRPIVAGILWKRIERGFPLGVDATSRYELKAWNDRSAFLVKLRDETDAYNTRHRKGLPPTPIGAPTFSSLEAALKPVASDYFYYLHDAEKQLHPSRNAEEHEALRKKYQVY